MTAHSLSLLLALLTAPAGSPSAKKPEQVFIGMYVNRIFNVSLKENKFSVDVYLWFRWKDEGLKPIETFEFMNGHIDTKESVHTKKIGEWNYASCRIVGTISKYWDVETFPLDNHTLRVTIEDGQYETSKVTYVVDAENCAMNPKLRFPGWTVVKSTPVVNPTTYNSNYGDISLPTGKESTYSRFQYNVEIERPGYGYFWKLFSGLFIAVLIAFLAFQIKVTDLDPRFGLGVGEIFAAVASQYVSSSLLPETHVLGMSDKLHITAFIFIFVSLAESTVSLALFEKGKEELSQKIDKWSFYICVLGYALTNYMVVYFR